MENLTTIGKVEFKTEVVKERSISPDVESLGICKNTMTLYRISKSQYYDYIIEWYVEDADGEEYVEEIGISIEGKKVTEYDGVFFLPQEAADLLTKHGFDVSKLMKEQEHTQKQNMKYHEPTYEEGY